MLRLGDADIIAKTWLDNQSVRQGSRLEFTCQLVSEKTQSANTQVQTAKTPPTPTRPDRKSFHVWLLSHFLMLCRSCLFGDAFPRQYAEDAFTLTLRLFMLMLLHFSCYATMMLSKKSPISKS